MNMKKIYFLFIFLSLHTYTLNVCCFVSIQNDSDMSDDSKLCVSTYFNVDIYVVHCGHFTVDRYKD